MSSATRSVAEATDAQITQLVGLLYPRCTETDSGLIRGLWKGGRDCPELSKADVDKAWTYIAPDFQSTPNVEGYKAAAARDVQVSRAAETAGIDPASVIEARAAIYGRLKMVKTPSESSVGLGALSGQALRPPSVEAWLETQTASRGASDGRRG